MKKCVAIGLKECLALGYVDRYSGECEICGRIYHSNSPTLVDGINLKLCSMCRAAIMFDIAISTTDS